VWGLARALDGRVLLRIEDHDRQRCRPEYETALLEDLDWLGFAPDVYPPDVFRSGRCDGRQSDRDAAYREALRPLVRAGLVYGCDCTRRQIDAPAYSGRCRNRGLAPSEGVGWRVRVDDRVEIVDDLRLGIQPQRPAMQCGDLLIRDRLGNWTYQWAATADDTLQEVSLVIRGEDLIDSTGRQIGLARQLGRADPPAFLHHPLVMKSPTQKLSKADGDTGVRDLRGTGWTAATVIGHAAWLAGLQPTAAPLDANDVGRLFAS
jgi:glutamyl-tRNA synthetase/glutamyl-Q tRNA(Asp) synthetase